jgi:hypothetical protein
MSVQTVIGFAKCSGRDVPLEASITDTADDQELTSDVTYTVTAQSLGTIAEGQNLTHLSVTATTGICYAGVLRNGQYIGVCQALGSNKLGGAPKYAPVMPGSIRLVAGDQVIVRTEP